MADIYQSRYTGEQIEEKLDNSTKVVANPSDTATTNLTKLKVEDTTYNLPSGTNVVANPTDTATTNLTKLKVDNTTYNIPSGSGTNVVANPTDTATTNLTKLKVEDTTYNIPSYVEVNSPAPRNAYKTANTIKLDGTKYDIYNCPFFVTFDIQIEANENTGYFSFNIQSTNYSIIDNDDSLFNTRESVANMLHSAPTLSIPVFDNGVLTDVKTFKIFTYYDELENLNRAVAYDILDTTTFYYGVVTEQDGTSLEVPTGDMDYEVENKSRVTILFS